MSLAGAGVALIILIDLATGQGPPALNAFMGPPREYLQMPPPPAQLQPIGYMPRGEYDGERNEYDMKKDAKESLIEAKKDDKKHSPSFNPYDKDAKSTPAPGVFASFSNSMSDAWSK